MIPFSLQEPHGNGPLFVEMHFYMRNAKLTDSKCHSLAALVMSTVNDHFEFQLKPSARNTVSNRWECRISKVMGHMI